MRTLLVAAVLFALPVMAETTTHSATQEALKNAATTTDKALDKADKAVADASAAITETEKSMAAEHKALKDTKEAANNAAHDAAAHHTH